MPMPFLTDVCHMHFDSTDSTNTQLITHIAQGLLDEQTCHLFTADHQTAGRGQHGRSWVSGADNVLLSLYVPLGRGDYALHALSGLLSLAVGRHLANLSIITDINRHRLAHHLPVVGVKWANDLGFYDDTDGLFCKLAGILIEPVFKKTPERPTSHLVGIVIGVGLNVNHAPVIKDGLYQATCLKALIKDTPLDAPLCAKDCYSDITNALLQAVQECNACQDDVHCQAFIHDFERHHVLSGHQVNIFIQNDTHNIHAQGECIGIGTQGELLLKDGEAITPILAGMAQIQKPTQSTNPQKDTP